MRYFRVLMIALLVLPASMALAQEDPGARAGKGKRAWEWTDEERIAARLNPDYVWDQQPTGDARFETLPRADYVIDGSKTPELFMPSELFAWLMNGLAPRDDARNTFREMLRERIEGFGYADDTAFWNELQQVTASHAKLRERRAALEAKRERASKQERLDLDKDIAELEIPLCQSRAKTLAAARAHFGRAKFDQFLYTVVAPRLSRGSRRPTPDEARGLSYLEGGCQ